MFERDIEAYSQRLEAIVENAFDGILSVDESSRITFMNKSARELFGYSATDIQQLTLHALIPVNVRDKHDGYMKSFSESTDLARDMRSRATLTGVRKDGSEFPIEVSISKIKVAGEIEMIAVMRDISVRARLIKELQEAATLDQLTGLANKRLFDEELKREVALSLRYKQAMCLVLFDLDHFKQVNDTHGHSGGDEVLKVVARLTREEVRQSDLSCRWGGEEFAILLPKTQLKGAITLAEKLRLEIASYDFDLSNKRFNVSASFGVVEIDIDGESVKSLFERCDSLLYAAKKAGRNCVHS